MAACPCQHLPPLHPSSSNTAIAPSSTRALLLEDACVEEACIEHCCLEEACLVEGCLEEACLEGEP